MRAGFTIVFNGLHHLQHNDYAARLGDMLDLWVVVDGLSLPGGTTAWCKGVADKWHRNGSSIDGTVEHMENMVKLRDNVIFVRNGHNSPWASKDVMVNVALDVIRRECDGPLNLWEIDADEQWDLTTMDEAEAFMELNRLNCVDFLADFYVGEGLVVKGRWGEGNRLPYRRLWRWNGETFAGHEPPRLARNNTKSDLCGLRFSHYAYYFPVDVIFKEEFYGYANLYENWCKLNSMLIPPDGLPASFLSPDIAAKRSTIYRV